MPIMSGSRLTILARFCAAVALGAGAIGYAATLREGDVAPAPQAAPAQKMQTASKPPRAPDRTITIQPHQSLAAALLKVGVGGLDAALADTSAGPVEGRALVWLGEDLGTDAKALERLEVRQEAGRRVVLQREGDGFVRSEVVEAVDRMPVRVRLSGAEIAPGLVGAGLPRALRNEVLDRAAGKPIAMLDLIVAHESAGERDADYGRPLYLGLYLKNGRLLRWIDDGGHLRPVGDKVASEGLLRPLPGPVTSSPGLRFHPILRFLRWHRGTDFAAPQGAPVQAALGGRVLEAGWEGGYGRTVRVRHADGTTTLYAHLSSIDVAAGAAVAQGAVLGRVGSTGLATGPHLHFEWRRDGDVLVPSFAAMSATAGQPGDRAALRAILSAPYRLPPRRAS